MPRNYAWLDKLSLEHEEKVERERKRNKDSFLKKLSDECFNNDTQAIRKRLEQILAELRFGK